MFLLNGKPISPDVAFTTPDGTQYPANWIRLATPDERAAIGITEVPDPAPYDQRFYWGPGLPKDHAELVTQWTATTRTTANTLLAPTDWVIIREADNGKVADPLLKTWRQDVRFAAGEKITAIEATVSTADLAAYITGAEYPVWPADPYGPQPKPTATFDDTMTFSGGATGAAIL